MRVNKLVLAFTVSAAILSGCSTTDEKNADLLNGQDGAATTGYSDGSSLSGEQFGTNGLGGSDVNGVNGNNGSGVNILGPEFSDPTNPLSTQTIYFMYDSSQVQQDFISVIAAHGQYLLNHPAQRVILEGHADERGTREYNIALGEQRGKSVYRMMKIQGVSDNQLEVVSYGEEKPTSDGMDEASWQLNRRVEIAYQVQ